MYVCMYVCTYVRTYVCMHACMHAGPSLAGMPCCILRLLTQQNVVLRYSNLDADVSVPSYGKKTFAPLK